MSFYELWTLWYFTRHPFDLELLIEHVLQTEHPDLVVELRGGAGGHGDEGRDVVLKARRTDPEPVGLVQVSAQEEWREKFRREFRSFVTRVKEGNYPDIPKVWIFASVQAVHTKTSSPRLHTPTDKDDELRWALAILTEDQIPTTVEIWGLQDIVSVISHPEKGATIRVAFEFPDPPDDSLSNLVSALDSFSNAALRGISDRIEGLGSLPRPEARVIQTSLDSEGEVLVVGEGGSGKSALVANATKHARERGFAVLFIRASTFSPEDDLTAVEERLAIRAPLMATLTRMASNLPTLLIVDQLDSVANSQFFTSLIGLVSTASATQGISVLVASRTWQADKDPELGRLRFPRVVSSPLDEQQAYRHLRTLGLRRPTVVLIDLSTNLLNLSIIGDLINSGDDVTKITGKIDLWHRYRRSLEQREGRPAVEYAVDLAKSALSLNVREFGIPLADETKGDKLISRGLLVPSRGETFRFRHQEIRDYLYSWDASMRRQITAGDVKREVTERLSRGPLAWMLRMYWLEMPERAAKLLTEVLTQADWQFYTKADLLDIVLEIERPSSELADLLAEAVRDEKLADYFFRRLTHADWLLPLAARGAFSSPPLLRRLAQGTQVVPWPQGDYLARVASDRPKKWPTLE